MKRILLLTSLLAWSLQGLAQNEIVDQWYNEEKSSIITVSKNSNGTYSGKITWLEDNTNADGSSPRRDEFNPEASRQNRLLKGLTILTDLEYNREDQQWQNGLIYDPENGKTYECYCELNEDGTLYFKGYILGITWLGRSTTWTRVE
jgi:uncharacterized protein (DUF2147 family)